ncbi:MAG: hypothetical protein U0269_30725 [Polyangiales bacterium]
MPEKDAAIESAESESVREEFPVAQWIVRCGESGRCEAPKHARVWRITAMGPRDGFAKIEFEGTDLQWIVPAGATWVVEPEGFVDASAVVFNDTAAFAVEWRVS